MQVVAVSGGGHAVQASGQIAEDECEWHRLPKCQRDVDAGTESEILLQDWFCETAGNTGYSGEEWE